MRYKFMTGQQHDKQGNEMVDYQKVADNLKKMLDIENHQINKGHISKNLVAMNDDDNPVRQYLLQQDKYFIPAWAIQNRDIVVSHKDVLSGLVELVNQYQALYFMAGRECGIEEQKATSKDPSDTE